jgi:DNA-binding phage protein
MVQDKITQVSLVPVITTQNCQISIGVNSFEQLSEVTNTPPKSLMRMFSQKGNPRARNLFAVISHLQIQSVIHLEERAVK